MMNIVKIVLPGMIMGFVVSFLMNYFIVPVPQTRISHAIGNGITGLFTALVTGLVLFLLMRKQCL